MFVEKSVHNVQRNSKLAVICIVTVLTENEIFDLTCKNLMIIQYGIQNQVLIISISLSSLEKVYKMYTYLISLEFIQSIFEI